MAPFVLQRKGMMKTNIACNNAKLQSLIVQDLLIIECVIDYMQHSQQAMKPKPITLWLLLYYSARG